MVYSRPFASKAVFWAILNEFEFAVDCSIYKTQSVCVADCYFMVNVLDLPFASPLAIYR